MHFLCKIIMKSELTDGPRLEGKKRSKLFIDANRNDIFTGPLSDSHADSDSDSVFLWCCCVERQTKVFHPRKWFQLRGVYGIMEGLMMMSQEPASPFAISLFVNTNLLLYKHQQRKSNSCCDNTINVEIDKDPPLPTRHLSRKSK